MYFEKHKWEDESWAERRLKYFITRRDNTTLISMRKNIFLFLTIPRLDN